MQVLRCRCKDAPRVECFGWLLPDLEKFQSRRMSQIRKRKSDMEAIRSIFEQRTHTTDRPRVSEEFAGEQAKIDRNATDVYRPSCDDLLQLVDAKNENMECLLAVLNPTLWKRISGGDSDYMRSCSAVSNTKRVDARRISHLIGWNDTRYTNLINGSGETICILSNIEAKLQNIKEEMIKMHIAVKDLKISLQEEDLKISDLIHETVNLTYDINKMKYLENLVLLLSGNLDKSDLSEMPCFWTKTTPASSNLII